MSSSTTSAQSTLFHRTRYFRSIIVLYVELNRGTLYIGHNYSNNKEVSMTALTVSYWRYIIKVSGKARARNKILNEIHKTKSHERRVALVSIYEEVFNVTNR